MDAGEFTYSIAINRPADLAGLPEGSEVFTVPASTWAKFTSRGPIRPNLQETCKRIFSEWLPASDWEHAGTPEMEYYPDGDPHAQDYYCEYWVPLKKGQDR
jgi:AraC family transcriptional regulator